MPVNKFLKSAHEIQQQAVSRRQHRRSGGGEGDEGNWLISYADMMTLLCGFFIMLFSMARLDEPKYEDLKEVMSKQFGGDYKSPSKELAKFVTQIIEETGTQKDTIVKVEGTGVTVMFQSLVLFENLSAEIAPKGQQILARIIDDLYSRQKKEAKRYQIVVEGHTDSRPITGGTQFATNWELSAARASRVTRYFADKGFEPGKLTAIGYGDTRPKAAARTPSGSYDEAALLKNRRVVLRILDSKADSIPLTQPEDGTERTSIPSKFSPATPSAAPGGSVEVRTEHL